MAPAKVYQSREFTRCEISSIFGSRTGATSASPTTATSDLPDIGGSLSFALALLNDQKDGVIVSCINGRNESRTFIKHISGGSSETTLSEEEELAIKQAFKENGRRVKDISSVKKSLL